MPSTPLRTRRHLMMTLATAAALTACGGGDDAVAPSANASTTFSGAIVKGPVNGASVCAYAVAAKARGARLGNCATTDANGNYTLSVPVATGAVWLEATGGSYLDEATAAVVALAAGSALTALAEANGASVSAYVTPLTTLALNAALASNATALDAAAFSQAVVALLNALGIAAGLDILHNAPVVTGTLNDYGTALLNISRMVAAGLPLAQILATTQPATLAAPYAAAASVAAPSGASLVISAATPASMSGRLDKLSAQFESNSSNALMTTYNDADPYCRVGAYALLNGSDMKKYYLEISYAKATGAVGLVKFGDDATFVALATAIGPQAAVAIDKSARRITFTNLGLGDNGGLLKLNGTLEYPTNVVPANRAACG